MSKIVVVTGAGGQIAYQLIFRIACGGLFGKNELFSLRLLEIPELVETLEGIKMELDDCAFPEIQDIQIGSDPNVLFEKGTHFFLVGAKPRGPGMERSDLLNENGKIFIEQGKALNKCADRKAKILVVGNPCNTNCLIAMQNAPDLDKRNFHAMTRLDQNRSVYQLSHKAGVSIEKVTHMTIWGNHSTTQVPDFMHAKISGKPVMDVIKDRKWLENDFINTIQKRGAAVIAKRGKSSAASAANASLEAMRDVCFPTKPEAWYSSGIWSQGNPYGIDQSLIYSFPCRTLENGKVEIVSGLKLDPFLTERLKKSELELKEEKEVVCQMSFSK